MHFYNCTRYGLEKWFEAFEIVDLRVSDNFSPAYTLSWIALEAESALRRDVSAGAADAFLRARCGDLVRLWRDPAARSSELWRNFNRLSDASKDVLAAGFELVARKVP